MINTKNGRKIALTLALMSMNAGLIAGNNASLQAGYTPAAAAGPSLFAAKTDKNGKGKKSEESYPELKTAKFDQERYFLSAQFLYWSTNYNSPFAFTLNSSSSSSTVDPITTDKHEFNQKLLNPSQTWDPGVRLAFGMGTAEDDWDFALLWTYYHNSSDKKTDSGCDDDDETIQSFWTSSGSWTEAKTKARLNYNVADFELGRSYYLSHKIHLRPFIGLRAGILDQDQHACLTDDNFITTISGVTYEIDQPLDFYFDHDMWGVGPRIGINTNWGSFKGFSILGNISAALMYGMNKSKLEIEQTTASVDAGEITKTINKNKFKQNNNELFPMLQIFLGFSWGHLFNNGKNSFRVNAGWESNFWWESANSFLISHDTHVTGVIDKAVSVQGLTLEFRVGF